MFLMMRGGRWAAWAGCLLLAGIAVFSGCTTGLGSGAPTTAKSKAPTKPTDETVSVELKSELGPFAPRARGVYRPSPTTELPADRLKSLGTLVQGRDGGPAAMLVTVGDIVKYDGAYPGQKANWSKWDQGVEALVRKTESAGRPVLYEVWKEPDNGRPFKDRLDFFATWVHTTQLIRKLSPGAVLVGPSQQKFDGGWIGEFLKVCKEYKTLPDIVSWHEDGLKHDISGHVGNMGETFWQDGSNIRHVIISPNAGIDDKQYAGDPAIYLGQMERSAKNNGYRRLTEVFEFKLTHLFTKELKPRSNYFTYQEYAAMAGTGQAVKLNASDTVDGTAVWNAAGNRGRILLGRNKSRANSKQILGTVTLKLNGLGEGVVHARASRIANSGSNASEGPAAVETGEYAVKNGEVKIPLRDFATADAFYVEFSFVSAPPATLPATHAATSRSTTGYSPASSNKSEPKR